MRIDLFIESIDPDRPKTGATCTLDIFFPVIADKDAIHRIDA